MPTFAAHCAGTRWHDGDRPGLRGSHDGDGFRAAAKAAWTGEAWDNQFAKLEGGYGDAIGGKLGKVIRFPTRMLQSEDSFFKALAFRTELNAAAVNKAAREGLLAEFPEIERLAIAERNRAMAEGRKREKVEQ